MPGIVCAVADCKNISKPNSPISFHRFPIKEDVQKSWIIRCKRKDSFNHKTSRVCSEHFTADDFERDLRNELLQLPLRKILKEGAIPSVFSKRIREASTSGVSRTERIKRRTNRKEVISLIDSVLTGEPPEYLTGPNGTIINYSLTQSHASCQVQTLKPKMLKENARLKRQISNMKFTIANLQKQVRMKKKTISLTRWRPGKPTKTFSAAQVNKLKGQLRVNWSTADIVKALSLRSVSLKAYETVREIWQLPLPAPSTLRRWLHRFQCAPGIQTDVIRILGEHTSSFGNLTRLCALTFDEMSLDGRFELDHVHGRAE